LNYILPFSAVRRGLELSTVQGELRVGLSYDQFVRTIKLLLLAVSVDTTWYLERYDDVAQAVRDGTLESPQRHFIEDGFFEGRMPFPINVDEAWYLEQNPDVAESIREGRIASAQEHFDRNGYREGRLPFRL
jgi:hypothetical protein